MKTRLKIVIGLWIGVIILGSCEERADYLNWSRKVANYCKYVKYSEESKRYECGPKLGEFYTYIIVHPDYILPKNPIYPLVAYDGKDNVVMVGGNEKGQIWRMIKFEIWAFVRETKTGMKEVYYDEEEKAFIGLEMGDNKEDMNSMAWWSRDGGKSWVRAKVPVLNKNKSSSVLPVSPLVVGPKLPAGAISEAVGGGYAVAIGELESIATIWMSEEKVPRDWEIIARTEIKNLHVGSLPGSLQKALPGDLKRIWYEGADFRIEDEDGDVWNSRDKGKSWEMGKFGGGSGTVGDPYEIASAAHLWLVRTELDKSFRLTKDLDLGVVTEPAGFDPIGDNANKFKGTFDGQGRVIRNLRIDRPTEDDIGLFGYTEASTVLKNIGLEDMDVTGKEYVGGLVGYNDEGRIERSYAMGSVTGNKFVGGLVGISYGTIGKSYATGNVTGSENNVGGLVGQNGETIENSYATGDVTGKNGIGGLVGINDGTIENSYATGSVVGNNFVGGFIGSNNLGASSIGKNYWKSGAQGVGQGNGANVERKTDAELKALDAGETGWSDEIWNFQAGQYPKLAWQD